MDGDTRAFLGRASLDLCNGVWAVRSPNYQQVGDPNAEPLRGDMRVQIRGRLGLLPVSAEVFTDFQWQTFYTAE
jgi:hypothetical protein